MTRLKVVRINGSKVKLFDLVKRYSWFYLVFEGLLGGFSFFNEAFNQVNTAQVYDEQLALTYLAFVAFFGIFILFLVLVLGIEHLMKHPFYYERMSQTKEINTVEREKNKGTLLRKAQKQDKTFSQLGTAPPSPAPLEAGLCAGSCPHVLLCVHNCGSSVLAVTLFP